ncbi:MAG: isochorismatase family protein [Alphaproteobacteria bacterium]|nr:isochorismatase family protein [Alphaproteobacteria bacterium]
MTLLASLQVSLPIALQPFPTANRRCGLVIVDVVNGFATVGAGYLAPPLPNDQVIRMVGECERLARLFLERGQPVAAFLDTHEPGKAEPPYPPHCERGSGEENLVPALKWLEGQSGVTLIRKDCINGFVGSIDLATGRNRMVDWVNEARLDSLLVTGICTDICVMDFVLTMLSARNHAMMPSLQEIAVHALGCATYDLTAEAARSLGLPATATHPQMVAHHIGLYLMASRGALLVDSVE